jgi:hypothetical protein
MLTLPPETERLARLVAERSGLPALRLRRPVSRTAKSIFRAFARSTRRVAEQPLRDTRTPKDIRDQAWGDPG